MHGVHRSHGWLHSKQPSILRSTHTQALCASSQRGFRFNVVIEVSDYVRRNEVLCLLVFTFASLLSPSLACSCCERSQQRGGSPEQALASEAPRIHCMIIRPAAGREERQVVRKTRGFLSLTQPQPTRTTLTIHRRTQRHPHDRKFEFLAEHCMRRTSTKNCIHMSSAAHESHHCSQVRGVRLGEECPAAHRPVRDLDVRLAQPCSAHFCLCRAGVDAQPNRHGSTQVCGERLSSHRLCWCTVANAQFVLVATMLRSYVQTLIKCCPCRIMPPLTDFLDCRFSCPVCVSKHVQGVWILLPLKLATDPRLPNGTNPLHVLQALSVRRHLWAQLHDGERDVGADPGQVVQPRRHRTEHGGLFRSQFGINAAFFVLGFGPPLGCYSQCGNGTCACEAH